MKAQGKLSAPEWNIGPSASPQTMDNVNLAVETGDSTNWLSYLDWLLFLWHIVICSILVLKP